MCFSCMGKWADDPEAFRKMKGALRVPSTLNRQISLAGQHHVIHLDDIEHVSVAWMWLTGKWADDPEAFRKMKAALGVQLAQALESSFGLDAEASQDYVDVLTDGFAIRLFLFSNRYAAWLDYFCVSNSVVSHAMAAGLCALWPWLSMHSKHCLADIQHPS